MKRTFIIIILVLFTIHTAAETKIITTDHIKPFRIRVDSQRIVISEGARISVYSKKDFKLRAQFGKAGEGPGEFKLLPEFAPEIDLSSGNILATSMGKITLITFEGEFLWEKNVSHLGRVELFRILGDIYTGNVFQVKEKKIWNAVNTYDKDLGAQTTVHRIPFHIQRGEKFIPITRGLYLPNFYVSGNIIWAGGALYKDNIMAYDAKGKLLREINPDIPKVRFTDSDKQGWIDSYMINADYKREYERLKKRFLYPEYFPLWQNFIIVNRKIYIQTFARNDKEGTNKFYIYNFDGKLQKTLWLPLSEYFDFNPDPYYINGEKLYQLSNNYDEETIELKISDIQ